MNDDPRDNDDIGGQKGPEPRQGVVAVPDDPPDEGSMVGYGRPPRHSRFKKGESGNPRGRRKGIPNLATDVKRTLEAPVKVSEHGKSKRVSTQTALLMRMREKALKGDARALDRLLDLARTYGDATAIASADSRDMSAADQAILDAYEAEIFSRISGPVKTRNALDDSGKGDDDNG